MGAKMLRKGLAVAVILLFIGVAVAPCINAVDDPVPDLDCDRACDFSEVEPGAIVECAFTVENIGEPESLLDWEIESYPDWGTWCFDPEYGIGLMPEDEAVMVVVEVVAPDDPDTQFTGEIKIVNSEDLDDFCIIDVILRINSIDNATPIVLVLQLITKLRNHKDIQKLEANIDSVDNVQDEIFSIIERDEELNSIVQQLSNEDCGCDEESSVLDWGFPVICLSLVPLVILCFYLYFWGGFGFLAQIVFSIGVILNCPWL